MVGSFTGKLVNSAWRRESLPPLLSSICRLGGDESFVCLAFPEYHEDTEAVTGFTLWLFNRGGKALGQHNDAPYLTAAEQVAEGCNVWKLRRWQQQILALSKRRGTLGTKPRLTIWFASPVEPGHAAPVSADSRPAWITWGPNHASKEHRLRPVNPDVRRIGL